MSIDLERNLTRILEQVEVSCRKVARKPQEVKIVAACKTQPATVVNSYIELCNRFNIPAIIAENYLQEFESKRPLLCGSFESHFIGSVQSNKLAKIFDLFDLVETVSSLKHLRVLQQQAAARGVVAQCFLQVNISADPAKSGFAEADILSVLDSCKDFSHLKVTGLMGILADYGRDDLTRADYAKLAALRNRLQGTTSEGLLSESLKLSMGMSSDFPIAIEEGADYVRIGTALFGDRI